MVYVLPCPSPARPTFGAMNLFRCYTPGRRGNGKLTVSSGGHRFVLAGPALCIFLGKTPISRGNEIRPASTVNVIGKINDIATTFPKGQDGEKITFRR